MRKTENIGEPPGWQQEDRGGDGCGALGAAGATDTPDVGPSLLVFEAR